MLSDFEECRQQALVCAQLSERSSSCEARDDFAGIAKGRYSLAARVSAYKRCLTCWRNSSQAATCSNKLLRTEAFAA